MKIPHHNRPGIGIHEMAIQELSKQSAHCTQRIGRWRVVECTVLIVGLIVFLATKGESNQVSKVMETERLILRDGAGNLRGEFSTGRDHSPTLWLFDKEGTRRAELSLLPDGTPGLRLFDERETIRIDIGLLESQPTLSIRDKTGKDRVKVVVTQDGEPYLQLHDTTGNVIWSTPAHKLEVIN
ncbi:MAG: hypothetical protein OJF47_001136 [Nitrospira sp.]|jgi:hypothetical protein|nr:MAG: hypothetical protein OJF47_001136 [Nitrospira sp.]